MLLLTREEEKVAEARAEARAEGLAEGRGIGREEGIEEGREIGLAEAAAKRAEEMRSLLNRLMINGFSRERAIALLGENIQ